MTLGYPRLKLPCRQLYISGGDSIDIEDEDGEVLLSFRSFDEDSGIECQGGDLIDDWNEHETVMANYTRVQRFDKR